MSFDNQTVLITGAAGNLGRAIAMVFSDAGARVVLVDRTESALKHAYPTSAGHA